MMELSGKVMPAVAASYFKALFNAWPTARQLRTLRGAKRAPRCLLCDGAEDSIEHIACCRCSVRVFAKFRVHCGNLIEFLALDSSARIDEILAAKAKALHVIFQIRLVYLHAPRSAALSPVELLRTIVGNVCSMPTAC